MVKADHAGWCTEVSVPACFSLAQSVAPAWWIGQRSPRHAWLDDALVVIEMRHEAVVWRRVSQPAPGMLRIEGTTGRGEPDEEWVNRVLHAADPMPSFGDPVIRAMADAYPGLHPYGDGSLFDGLLTAIIGQSISLASAAAAQMRLARSFNAGIHLCGREFVPLPAPTQLADASPELIRASGVTWKRAEGIIVAAREYLAGNLPPEDLARTVPEEAVRALMALPMVGRWTAESVLLWGLGVADAHPTNDIALLNAARDAYSRPGLDFKALDALAEQWRPGRSIAARLLWTKMFGYPGVTGAGPA